LVEEEGSQARSVAEALEDRVHEALAGRGGEGSGGEEAVSDTMATCMHSTTVP